MQHLLPAAALLGHKAPQLARLTARCKRSYRSRKTESWASLNRNRSTGCRNGRISCPAAIAEANWNAHPRLQQLCWVTRRREWRALQPAASAAL